MAQEITAIIEDFKRGDDFILDLSLTDPTDDSPVDITGWSIRSQVRLDGSLAADLTVSITDAAMGLFRVSAGASVTATWEPEKHSCDIEFTVPGLGVNSSETFTIDVCEDITRDDP